MNEKLTIGERFHDLRMDAGLTLEELAGKTGLSKSALAKYESDDVTDISLYAITTLAQFYGVTTDYLLGLMETKNHPNTALTELDLSDKTIEILTSGEVNNRLFCDLVEHPDFARLMVDLEIYANGYVSDRVREMNALLEATRETLEEEHQPDEDDRQMRTLQVAQIVEDEYFGRLIYEELAVILKDIRAAHANDITTSDGSAVEPIKLLVEEVKKAKGDPIENSLRAMYTQAGKDYDAVDKADIEATLRVMDDLTPMGYARNRAERRRMEKMRGRSKGKKKK